MKNDEIWENLKKFRDLGITKTNFLKIFQFYMFNLSFDFTKWVHSYSKHDYLSHNETKRKNRYRRNVQKKFENF